MIGKPGPRLRQGTDWSTEDMARFLAPWKKGLPELIEPARGNGDQVLLDRVADGVRQLPAQLGDTRDWGPSELPIPKELLLEDIIDREKDSRLTRAKPQNFADRWASAGRSRAVAQRKTERPSASWPAGYAGGHNFSAFKLP